MWIKICGNTSLEDARLAASLGADALGFIFAPSKRRVTPAQVAAITPHLPSQVELVGVFQGQKADDIVETVHSTGLTAVQIHGTAFAASEPTTRDQEAGVDLFRLARELSVRLGDRIRVIQALHWPVDAAHAPDVALRSQIAALADLPAIDRVLVDSRVGSSTGGTGITFNWVEARTTLSTIPSHLRLILAGGLNPENVREAIRLLQPWGVDAVTGIETVPGRKDAKKLAAFIEHARA